MADVGLFSRGGLPDGHTAPPGEKVLAWAQGRGGIVIATDKALHLPETATVSGRIAWHLVDRAAWRDPNLELALHATVGAPLQSFRVELTEPGKLPQVVRERVTGSVVTSIDVDLPGGAARIAARRTETNDIRWSVTPLDGADLSDAASREAATAVIAQLRDSLGL